MWVGGGQWLWCGGYGCMVLQRAQEVTLGSHGREPCPMSSRNRECGQDMCCAGAWMATGVVDSSAARGSLAGRW